MASDALLEIFDLPAGLFPSDAVALLNLAFELIAITGDLIHVVVGELAPLFLDLPGQLFPLALPLIAIHTLQILVLLNIVETWSQWGASNYGASVVTGDG